MRREVFILEMALYYVVVQMLKFFLAAYFADYTDLGLRVVLLMLQTVLIFLCDLASLREISVIFLLTESCGRTYCTCDNDVASPFCRYRPRRWRIPGIAVCARSRLSS